MPHPHRARALASATLALACALAACDAGTPEPDDLAPGTFRLEVSGRTYTGAATFHPYTENVYRGASVHLVASDSSVGMVVESDELLNAGPGDRVLTLSYIQAPDGALYANSRGAVLVTDTSGGGLAGRFEMRLSGTGPGPGRAPPVTVRGAFRARLASE